MYYGYDAPNDFRNYLMHRKTDREYQVDSFFRDLDKLTAIRNHEDYITNQQIKREAELKRAVEDRAKHDQDKIRKERELQEARRRLMNHQTYDKPKSGYATSYVDPRTGERMYVRPAGSDAYIPSGKKPRKK